MFNADIYTRMIQRMDPVTTKGRLSQVIGRVIEGTLPDCSIGQMCRMIPGGSADPVLAEVVGFRHDRVLMMPFGEMHGLRPGCVIEMLQRSPTIPVGPQLLGRVLDGIGNPMDSHPAIEPEDHYPIYGEPVQAFRRQRITDPLDLGVRALNGLTTCAVGQRVGIMAGSGVGKSTLLGMIARRTEADINVIALVGERGRELNDFIEESLGTEGLARSVVVASTSDRSPLERVRAAFVATAIAEYFRDQGKKVLLMMDSVTRFAMAQREIGLAIGEPPTTKGYTPSVFALLPKLLERAGMGEPGMGSITGLYTVLVDGDDVTEPIADSTRSILDGHIVLSRSIAEQGRYPAIDILASKSRLMFEVVSKEHRKAAQEIITLMAAYAKSEMLINIGAYAAGSNPTVDRAIRMNDAIIAYLSQDVDEGASLQDSIDALMKLAKQAAQRPTMQQPVAAMA